MDNRRSSGGQGHGDHQPIKYWEDIGVVLERERDVGRKHLSFNIHVQRPVLSDGTMGYYRLNTFIRIDNNYLQLSTSALSALANYFHYNRERIVGAVEEVRNRNSKIDEMLQEHARNSEDVGSRGQPDRFRGLENEPEGENPEDEEEEDESEEDDYEEVLIVNPPTSPDKPSAAQPNADAPPRRTRRNIP